MTAGRALGWRHSYRGPPAGLTARAAAPERQRLEDRCTCTSCGCRVSGFLNLLSRVPRTSQNCVRRSAHPETPGVPVSSARADTPAVSAQTRPDSPSRLGPHRSGKAHRDTRHFSGSDASGGEGTVAEEPGCWPRGSCLPGRRRLGAPPRWEAGDLPTVPFRPDHTVHALEGSPFSEDAREARLLSAHSELGSRTDGTVIYYF